ncbi:MAG: CpaF family protein [Proteobacteria bacterium]|nr:CpaF family protein [Pseudomonadota bacterium]
MATDENQNQTETVQNHRDPNAPLATIVWGLKDNRKTLNLPAGRYLIGDSAFAAIRIGSSGTNLSGALFVTPEKISIKCTGPQPVMYVEGRRLQIGETVILGDVMEMTIAATRVVLSSFRAVPRAETTEDDKTQKFDRKKSGLTHQDQVDGCHGDPDRIRIVLSKTLLEQMDVDGIDLARIDSDETRQKARLHLKKVVGETKFPAGFPFTPSEFEQQVFDEVMGLGPLEPLLGDSTVTEIMVNRRDQIFVEHKGKLTLSKVQFSSDQSLMNVIERIVSTVGRRIDIASPIVDARLVDGSRVNAVIPPLALKGPCLTIRRFSKTPINVQQLVTWNALSQEMCDFLKLVVDERKNVVISGGTGSGKTTLLNALSSFIPDGERIITVEDAAELQLQQAHVISLETRPPNLEGAGAVTIRDLVKNTLRMRPDRIVVGECRGGEALDMLQAMNTGHDGSMTTAHANTPEDLLRRLETMVMMSGMDLTLRAIREQIVSAVTIVVQIARRRNGRRLVTEIAWIRGLEKTHGEYMTTSLFKRNQADDPVICWDALDEFWKDAEFPDTPKSRLSSAKPIDQAQASSRTKRKTED